MQTISEPARTTPIVGNFDVIVCGGGPAGVAAAVTAARSGARVALLELQGILGGVWTSGLIPFIMDVYGKPGFIPELKAAHERFSGEPCQIHGNPNRPETMQNFFIDPEVTKYLLEKFCVDAGVHIQYFSRIVAVQLSADRRIEYVITESMSGRQAWKAHGFIDATGNGDVCALAGCRFEIGRDGSGEVQPFSMSTTVTGIGEDARPFISGTTDPDSEQAKVNFWNEIKRGGVEVSYTRPFLGRVTQGIYNLILNHESGYQGTRADHITQATLHGRREVFQAVQALRSLGGPWENLRVASTSHHIGVREGRRIIGRYRMNANDLITGAAQPDPVCTVHMPVDVHPTHAQHGDGYSSEGVRSKPYDISMRALIAADVDGLIMAGRCISGDFIAHASYRVTGNAVSIGEFAGALAACCAETRQLPHEADYNTVKALLQRVRWKA
jgi:hypothetical protein